LLSERGELPKLTDAVKRQSITEGRALIAKRNKVKCWLEAMGANLEEITTPEEALFFVFDHKHMREPSSIA
jgi:hypothetical protein